MSNKHPVQVEEDDRPLPILFKQLFPHETADELLIMVTETPAHMIMPLVRLKLIQEIINPDRKKSLLQIFREEFDRRMIARGREGRREAKDMAESVGRQESVDQLRI